MFELRPATAQDHEFLWEVQRTALGPWVDATWGWDEAFQRRYFDEHVDPRKHQIVRVEGTDAGFLSFEARSDHLYLANLALLPRFQRRGIGAELARFVIERAEEQGLPVRLQVLKANPARRFYERLGFSAYDETRTHFLMVRERNAP